MNHRERIRYPLEVIDLLTDLTEQLEEDAARFRARAMRIIEWGGWMDFDIRVFPRVIESRGIPKPANL